MRVKEAKAKVDCAWEATLPCKDVRTSDYDLNGSAIISRGRRGKKSRLQSCRLAFAGMFPFQQALMLTKTDFARNDPNNEHAFELL